MFLFRREHAKKWLYEFGKYADISSAPAELRTAALNDYDEKNNFYIIHACRENNWAEKAIEEHKNKKRDIMFISKTEFTIKKEIFLSGYDKYECPDPNIPFFRKIVENQDRKKRIFKVNKFPNYEIKNIIMVIF
tara:strand:- start:93 stop:494 length:402 start_codon:yes stop_codon:yes gene_type:complete